MSRCWTDEPDAVARLQALLPEGYTIRFVEDCGYAIWAPEGDDSPFIWADELLPDDMTFEEIEAFVTMYSALHP